MISRIIDIAKRSAQYIDNLNANISRVIETNQGKTIDFNRMQMIQSKDADGNPLTHSRTGSTYLSKAYARRMRKLKPDLFVNGQFMDAMFLTMPNEKEYFISSKDYKTQFLAKNYGHIFGIASTNQPKVQAINNKLIFEDFKKIVFK